MMSWSMTSWYFCCSRLYQRELFIQRAVRDEHLPDGMSWRPLRLPLRNETRHQEGWLSRMHWSVKPAFCLSSSISHKFQAFITLCPCTALILKCEYPTMWKWLSNRHTIHSMHIYTRTYITVQQHTNTYKTSGLHPEKNKFIADLISRVLK
jgi:hypothetical protein